MSLPASQPERLDQPPFPPMAWDICEWWTGEVDLSFGKCGALTVTPYDPGVSRVPSVVQAEALTFHFANGERVLSSVLTALLPYYQKMRPKYRAFLGTEFDRLMPQVEHAVLLRGLIDFRHLHVHPWAKDGMGYVGVQFGCTWDVEHGLGVMMHQDRVVEIGSADVSFASEPDE